MDTGPIPEPDGWQDPLSGLEGPDFWRRVLIAEVARALRYRRPMTVVVVELTGIASLVGSAGGDVGLIAVREAARCLRRTSRTSDHCTRIGPARFAILLTETDEIAAINFVERVRDAGPELLPRTRSGLGFAFGWASPKLGESPEAVLQRALHRLDSELTDIPAAPALG